MRNRIERINVALKKEISFIIAKDLNDPRINFISIIDVYCTEDLKSAKVYFKSQDEDKHKMEEILNKASGYITHKLSEKIRLRHIPKITFHYDDTEIYFKDNIN